MLSGRKFHEEHFFVRLHLLELFTKIWFWGTKRAQFSERRSWGVGTFRGCLGHLTWHIFTKSRFPPGNVFLKCFLCLYRLYYICSFVFLLLHEQIYRLLFLTTQKEICITLDRARIRRCDHLTKTHHRTLSPKHLHANSASSQWSQPIVKYDSI